MRLAVDPRFYVLVIGNAVHSELSLEVLVVDSETSVGDHARYLFTVRASYNESWLL